jgi:hypothetical protein
VDVDRMRRGNRIRREQSASSLRRDRRWQSKEAPVIALESSSHLPLQDASARRGTLLQVVRVPDRGWGPRIGQAMKQHGRTLPLHTVCRNNREIIPCFFCVSLITAAQCCTLCYVVLCHQW